MVSLNTAEMRSSRGLIELADTTEGIYVEIDITDALTLSFFLPIAKPPICDVYERMLHICCSIFTFVQNKCPNRMQIATTYTYLN